MTAPSRGDGVLRRYGRQFQEYSATRLANILPVDEVENEREREWHSILKEILHDDLRDSFKSAVVDDRGIVFARVDEIRSVLDCGYGVGVWADDLMEALRDIEELHEETQRWKICGIDVSREPTQFQRPGSSSSGSDSRSSDASSLGDATFALKLKWDLNDSLTDNRELFTHSENRTKWANEPFDLVNIRCLTDGLKYDRWRYLLRELWTLLRPRGCIQLVEMAFANIQSDSGRLAEAPGLKEWTDCYREGMKTLGRDELHMGKVLGERLHWAEFEEIESQCLQIDIGSWRTTGNATISNRVLDVMESTLESLGIWPACAALGKSVEEFQEIVQRAMADLRKPEIKPYLWCYVFIGRKPKAVNRKRKSVDLLGDDSGESSSMAAERPPFSTRSSHPRHD